MSTPSDQMPPVASSPAEESANSFELEEFGQDFPPGEFGAAITGERPQDAPPAPVVTEAKEPPVVAPVAKEPGVDEQKMVDTPPKAEDFGESVAAPALEKPAEETTPPAETPPVEATPPVVDEAKPVEEKVKTPEELTAERAEFKKQLEEQLVPQFPISDDELASISDSLVEPAVRKQNLAKLMSRATVHAVELAMAGIAPMLPMLFQTVQRTEAEHAKWRTAFFSQFPDLNKPEYGPTIDRAAQVLASDQSKGQLKPEQFMKELGVATSMILRIPLPEQIMRDMASDRAPAPATPPPPARPAGVRAQGTAPGATRVTEEFNEFADL